MGKPVKLVVLATVVPACRQHAAGPMEDRWTSTDVELVTAYAFYPGTALLDAMKQQPAGSIDAVLLDLTDSSSTPVVIDVSAQAHPGRALPPPRFITTFDAPSGRVTKSWEGVAENRSEHFRALAVVPPGTTVGHTKLR